MDQKKLDQQSQHWEASFLSKPEMFGIEPSIAAVKSLKSFQEHNIKNIIELGAGLGRDTIFFAKNSIHVEALDYSKTSIANILNKFDTIGIDLVAMCVNDLIVQGAKPIIFLDYISINKIDLFSFCKSFKTSFNLSSKSPRYLVPASRAPISKE